MITSIDEQSIRLIVREEIERDRAERKGWVDPEKEKAAAAARRKMGIERPWTDDGTRCEWNTVTLAEQEREWRQILLEQVRVTIREEFAQAVALSTRDWLKKGGS